MQKTEFQIESTKRLTQEHLSSTATITDTRIQSLLCGLCLRGWLSDNEKEMLDLLAPGKGITFMVLDGSYVHPEDVELFSPEQLSRETGITPGAVVSRNMDERHRNNRFRNIHTAVISSDSSMTVMLGMICPKPLAKSDCENDTFGQLILRFRAAYSAIADGIPHLRKALDEKNPTLIVDRSSGRILAVNHSTELRLGKPEKKLVGIEYGAVKRRLVERLEGSKLSLKSASVANLSLILFSIYPASKNSNHQDSDPPQLPGRHIVHKLRNSLSALHGASDFLQTMPSDKNNSEREQLHTIMTSEIASLCRQADLVDLLVNFSTLRSTEIDIQGEVAQSVKMISQECECSSLIHIREQCQPGELRTVPKALGHMCECVLRSHLPEDKTSATTVISFETGDNNQTVIVIETDCSTGEYRVTFNNDWLGYVSYLGDLLRDSITIAQMQIRRKLITRISLNDIRSN